MKLTFILFLSVFLFWGFNLALSGDNTASSVQSPQTVRQDTSYAKNDMERVNKDGAVTIKVKPLNLGDKEAATIVFDVTMDTHSVNLNFDLSKLSILRNNNGTGVMPSAWSAPRGGHHVEGKLIFPAGDIKDWKSLILVIKNVEGIQERIFTWDLP